MLYLDTSVVVTFLTPEPSSQDTKEWITAHQNGGIAISDWVGTEFLSALAIKTRSGALTSANAMHAEKLFVKWRKQLVTVDFRTHFFADAGRYLAPRNTSLRAGDALHLAIAAAHSATLCTRDRGFAEAATQIGHAVELV